MYIKTEKEGCLENEINKNDEYENYKGNSRRKEIDAIILPFFNSPYIKLSDDDKGFFLALTQFEQWAFKVFVFSANRFRTLYKVYFSVVQGHS